MYKKINAIIMCIIMILIVSGCSITKPPSELIYKPKNSIKGIELESIVSEFLLDKETLTLTEKESNKEAIRRVDMDKDGEDELLLLYKGDKNSFIGKNEYGVIVLKKNKGKWHEINRISQEGYGLDLVDYKDLTGDKKTDLLIGWSNEEQKDKYLEVYSWHDGYFHSIFKTSYRELAVEDLKGDGQNQLVLLKKTPKIHGASIEVLRYLNEDMISVDNIVINNGSYFSTMTVGNASSNKKGIFIDFDMGTFYSYTDLLIMKDNKLVEVLGNESINTPKTMNEYMIKSKDINKDGIIEIGNINHIPVSQKFETRAALINNWYQWNGKDDITLVLKEYYNHDEGYKIQIPKEWGNEIIILKSDEKDLENKVEFYSIDRKNNLDKCIFSIESFSKERWNNDKDKLQDKEYVILEENEKNIIIGIISDMQKASKYYINKERLRRIFYLIEE